MVIKNTRSRVKIKLKLTNFKIKSQIEGYNGSNPQGTRKKIYDFFELDQIGQ